MSIPSFCYSFCVGVCMNVFVCVDQCNCICSDLLCLLITVQLAVYLLCCQSRKAHHSDEDTVMLGWQGCQASQRYQECQHGTSYETVHENVDSFSPMTFGNSVVAAWNMVYILVQMYDTAQQTVTLIIPSSLCLLHLQLLFVCGKK